MLRSSKTPQPQSRLARLAYSLFAVSAALVLYRAGEAAYMRYSRLPMAQLSIGAGSAARVECATEERDWERGLQWRASLDAPDHGMLFVFEGGDKERVFWMKNTEVPLDVAFISTSGRITSVASMDPQSLAHHRGVGAYALEMARGWFEANGIGAGDEVRGMGRCANGEK